MRYGTAFAARSVLDALVSVGCGREGKREGRHQSAFPYFQAVARSASFFCGENREDPVACSRELPLVLFLTTISIYGPSGQVPDTQ
jgi:hypothetical protein